MQNKKGFTIIELLVVIAIIAILAAIVLVNVAGYINKARNAAIKGNMASMIVRAAAYFEDNPSNFGATFIASTSYTVPDAAVAKANGGTALTKFGATATQEWCSCSVIYTITGTGAESGTFCVDSTGYKKVTVTACSTRCASASAAWCVDS